MAEELDRWVQEATRLVTLDGKEQPCISANELYEKLGLDASNFSRWQKEKINSLKLKEGKDFEFSSLKTKNPSRGRPMKVAVLTLRAAIQAAATTLESNTGLALLGAMTALLQRYLDGDAALAQDIIKRQTNPQKVEEIHQSAQDHLVSLWRRYGRSEDWIRRRLECTIWRTMFTDCLKQHGVKDHGYGMITNGMYRELTGLTAGELKVERLVAQSRPARDGLTLPELIRVQFAESMAACDIQNQKAFGNSQCCTVSMNAARRAANA